MKTVEKAVYRTPKHEPEKLASAMKLKNGITKITFSNRSNVTWGRPD